MNDRNKTIYVYADWFHDAPVLMGCLYVQLSRGKEAYSFEYAPSWLNGNLSAVSFDPDLQLFAGRQYVPLNKSLFGIFSDSCPDRWGRLLMNRRESIAARKEQRKPEKLMESD